MRRSTTITAIVSAAVAGLVLIWNTIGQDRAFRALIAEGDAALAASDTSGAAAAFSGALAIQPESMLAHLKRGDTYRRRGELAAALADVTAANTLDPAATRVKELLGDVNAELGRTGRAVDAYRACLALDERAPIVLVKLGGVELRDGQTTAALATARKALALDADLAEAHYLEGLALRTSNPPQAALAFGRAVELKPSFLAAREQLAAVLLASGRVREGVEALESLAALEPSQPSRVAAVVTALAEAGKTDSALLRLTRADEQFTEDPTLAAIRGHVLLDRAETYKDRALLAEAEAMLNPLAQRDHPPAAILAAMGRARLLAGDPQGALPWLERATAQLPVAPEALRLLARAATEAANDRLALDALIRHEAVNPGSTFALTHARRIAAYALASGNIPLALHWAERALRLAPGDADAVALLADARRRAGPR
ncbi:MAG: tetratricopeptide repeat protein [Vicinamibacterales bacterium]